jgi:hypothetical protein
MRRVTSFEAKDKADGERRHLYVACMLQTRYDENGLWGGGGKMKE